MTTPADHERSEHVLDRFDRRLDRLRERHKAALRNHQYYIENAAAIIEHSGLGWHTFYEAELNAKRRALAKEIDLMKAARGEYVRAELRRRRNRARVHQREEGDG